MQEELRRKHPIWRGRRQNPKRGLSRLISYIHSTSEQKKEQHRKVQQDSTKWRVSRTVNRKTVAQEEQSGTKASGDLYNQNSVHGASTKVVEYIAPTPAVPLYCCKGQVKDEMKGGSFASKYQEGKKEKKAPRQQ